MKTLVLISEEIAREAHTGQKYDTRDYVAAHVQPISQLIASLGYNELFQAVGWLHDVLEDSDFTAQDLLDRSIPNEVVVAVQLITNKTDQKHADYLQLISENELAIVAKFADSSINYANTLIRATEIDHDKLNSWLHKYANNIAYLFPRLPKV